MADTEMQNSQPSDHSRSPSPIQPPPTPSAPGPRATALNKLHNDAINHVLKTCNYHNFASCFPTIAQQKPATLKHLHQQFTDGLGIKLRKEFDALLVERNVTPSLNELDRVLEDARRRKQRAESDETPVPLHTLPARQLYLSHLAPSLSKYGSEVQARQEALSSENQELIERVVQQRKDIMALINGLESVVGDLNGSVAAMNPEELEALKETNREADVAMT